MAPCNGLPVASSASSASGSAAAQPTLNLGIQLYLGLLAGNWLGLKAPTLEHHPGIPPAPPSRLRNLGPGRFPISMDWQPEAEQQLKEVPFFVRPIVRKRIEKLAAEAGLAAVDTAFYQQSKAKFGQK
jgi:hypothetical protein